MNDAAPWPRPAGPYDGNAAFDVDLRPPLAPVWSHPVTGKFNDGYRVGARGVVVVPTRGQDVEGLALEDGKLLWAATGSRSLETEVYVAGEHAWALKGGNRDAGFDTSRISLAAGERRGLPLALVPQGVYRDAKGDVFLQQEERIRLDAEEVEKSGVSIFGRMKDGRAYGRVAPSLELACYEPAAGRTSWTRAPRGGSEVPLCVGDGFLATFARAGQVVMRDCSDGALLWEVPTAHTWDTIAPFVISGGLFFRWENRDLIAHQARTGEIAWKLPSGATRSNFIATREHLWVGLESLEGDSRLLALDKSTGQEIWRLRSKAKLAGLALALIQGRLLALAGKKLTCYRSA